MTFLSTPAAPETLNQITGATGQFFIIRLLHIRNEKDKGHYAKSGGQNR